MSVVFRPLRFCSDDFLRYKVLTNRLLSIRPRGVFIYFLQSFTTLLPSTHAVSTPLFCTVKLEYPVIRRTYALDMYNQGSGERDFILYHKRIVFVGTLQALIVQDEQRESGA